MERIFEESSKNGRKNRYSKHLTRFFLIILILPMAAPAKDNKEYNNYDYYGYYDSMDDDGNYAELGPTMYDYDEKEEPAERPKKDVSETLDSNWAHISLADESSTECEPETPETTTAPPAAPPAPESAPESAPTAAPAPTGDAKPAEETTCIPVAVAAATTTTTTCTPPVAAFNAPKQSNEQEQKAKELRELVQHLYISQARVQLEASEIKKAQAIANEAQQQLEESANHVRAVTAALQNAQQEVATSAMRAQTAQLQLAAHDQLLFAARQDVDALSSRMVGLQAAEGIAQPKVNFDIQALMQKLRQPLMDADKPTPVPSIVLPSQIVREGAPAQMPPDFYYDEDYDDY